MNSSFHSPLRPASSFGPAHRAAPSPASTVVPTASGGGQKRPRNAVFTQRMDGMRPPAIAVNLPPIKGTPGGASPHDSRAARSVPPRKSPLAIAAGQTDSSHPLRERPPGPGSALSPNGTEVRLGFDEDLPSQALLHEKENSHPTQPCSVPAGALTAIDVAGCAQPQRPVKPWVTQIQVGSAVLGEGQLSIDQKFTLMLIGLHRKGQFNSRTAMELLNDILQPEAFKRGSHAWLLCRSLFRSSANELPLSAFSQARVRLCSPIASLVQKGEHLDEAIDCLLQVYAVAPLAIDWAGPARPSAEVTPWRRRSSCLPQTEGEAFLDREKAAIAASFDRDYAVLRRIMPQLEWLASCVCPDWSADRKGPALH